MIILIETEIISTIEQYSSVTCLQIMSNLFHFFEIHIKENFFFLFVICHIHKQPRLPHS